MLDGLGDVGERLTSTDDCPTTSMPPLLATAHRHQATQGLEALSFPIAGKATGAVVGLGIARVTAWRRDRLIATDTNVASLSKGIKQEIFESVCSGTEVFSAEFLTERSDPQTRSLPIQGPG